MPLNVNGVFGRGAGWEGVNKTAPQVEDRSCIDGAGNPREDNQRQEGELTEELTGRCVRHKQYRHLHEVSFLLTMQLGALMSVRAHELPENDANVEAELQLASLMGS